MNAAVFTRFVAYLSLFFFILSTGTLACPEPEPSTARNETNITSEVENPINCTITISEDPQPADDKFPIIGAPVKLSSSIVAINSTLTPSKSMKWRTLKYDAIAILIWGSFERANGDYLQMNKRVFHGVSRCIAHVVSFQFEDKKKTVLIGLKNSSGSATLKFAPMPINSNLMKAIRPLLECKEVLEYVGTSDEKLTWFKYIVTSDAGRFIELSNKVREDNVHICNIFQRYKTHCGGFYAAQPCAEQ